MKPTSPVRKSRRRRPALAEVALGLGLCAMACASAAKRSVPAASQASEPTQHTELATVQAAQELRQLDDEIRKLRQEGGLTQEPAQDLIVQMSGATPQP